MKIPKQLPQFKSAPALIVVSARHNAAFYLAKDGELSEIDSFHVDKPKYTDRESEFKTRSHGKTIRSGSSIEMHKKDAIIRDFVTEFCKHAKTIHAGFKQLYVLAPDDTRPKIVSSLPANWRKGRHVKVLAGNYYYRHPLEVVKKIATV